MKTKWIQIIFVLFIIVTIAHLNRRIETIEQKPKDVIVIPISDMVRISERFYIQGEQDFYKPKLTNYQIDSIVKTYLKLNK